jgi:hypothetical protein
MKAHRWILFVSQAAVVAACGSRTGLLVPSPEQDASATDAREEPDARDAHEEDALPPIDVIVPPDAPNPCPDAGSTLVYVITSQNVLLSFYPPTAEFRTIGTIACPITVAGDDPFSMAVDHTGVAYVAFESGNVFKVSTLTAACEATARIPSGPVFTSGYGMGFSANFGLDAGESDSGDNVETLYLAGNPGGAGMVGANPIVLGSMDTTTFEVTTIGTVSPSIYGSELTGTGGGQLFGFFQTSAGSMSAAIGQIDKTTAQLVAVSDLPGVSIAGGWAFAFWGGDFYTFTAPAGSMTATVVQRFSPSDGSIVQVATTPNLTVVGAGVSTCAPQM